MKYGQVLSRDVVILPIKGIGHVLTHYCLFMHLFYMACFAFDLAALVGLAGFTERIVEDAKITEEQLKAVSYSGKDSNLTFLALALGIRVHITAYFHTVFILREWGLERAPHPITYLHLVYAPLSILLLVWIRW